ncbi:MAG: MMPL family transporter [Deltaproteobacteria bacterium]|nr:MMPL family transporter [Deltaproteobacteria bacterium]
MKNAASSSATSASPASSPASPSTFDRALRAYVSWVTRHPWVVIAGVAAATVLLGAGLPKIYLANERKLQLPGNDPLVKIDDRILEIFGGGKYTLIGVEAKQGDVFQPEVLAIVKKILRRRRGHPGRRPQDVISLTARKSKAIENGEPGELIVKRLVEKLPTNDAEAEVIRKRVMGQKLLRGYLVSDDGKTTAVAADLDDLDPRPELGNQILTKRFEEVIAPYRHSEKVNVYLSGWPIFQTALDKYTMGILQLLGVAVLVIGLVHLEAFRTFQAMVLPLVTAVLSVTWAMGFLGWTRFPLDAWASLAPFLILAVAAGHAVQILKRYYEEFRRCGENDAAVIESTSRVGGVMITAGLIAAAGFLSLTLFPIRTVQVFGVLTSFGILSALAIEMTFIPACRTLLPAPKVGEVKAESHTGLLETVLERLAAGILARPAGALAVAAVVLAVVVYGISRVEVDNSFRRAYPVDEPVYVDDEALSKSFGGTNTMNILVEGDHDDALHDPAVLHAMEGLQKMLTSMPHVGRSQSIVDFLEQMNVAMNDGDEAFRVIPESREAVAQLFLLLGGPRRLRRVRRRELSQGGDPRLRERGHRELHRHPLRAGGRIRRQELSAHREGERRRRHARHRQGHERVGAAREAAQRDRGVLDHLRGGVGGAALARRGRAGADADHPRGAREHGGDGAGGYLPQPRHRHDHRAHHLDRRRLLDLLPVPLPRGARSYPRRARRHARHHAHLGEGDLLRGVGDRLGLAGAVPVAALVREAARRLRVAQHGDLGARRGHDRAGVRDPASARVPAASERARERSRGRNGRCRGGHRRARGLTRAGANPQRPRARAARVPAAAQST